MLVAEGRHKSLPEGGTVIDTNYYWNRRFKRSDIPHFTAALENVSGAGISTFSAGDVCHILVTYTVSSLYPYNTGERDVEAEVILNLADIANVSVLDAFNVVAGAVDEALGSIAKQYRTPIEYLNIEQAHQEVFMSYLFRNYEAAPVEACQLL